ncbi:Hypothetical predicted protein [Paramuricea clavata]|uniref:Uncharacterized protein n=1 Tax=Paramuricea clavata TaxID=317549 RepID=A0A6S7JAS5_PARCT|nr:Hypothetical predicted protein [Paramuricea clavata]
MWLERKESMGFSSKTHSDFDRHLLLNFSEDQPKQQVESPSRDKFLPFVAASIPIGKGIPVKMPNLCLTRIADQGDNINFNSSSRSTSDNETGVHFFEGFSDEYDPEETISATEDEDVVDRKKGEEDMDISNVEDPPTSNGPIKPNSLEERNERLAQEMKNAFSVLERLGNNSDLFGKHFKRDHVIVDVPLLLETFNNGCQHLSCPGASIIQNTNWNGGVLTFSWECSKGHLGYWRSSNVLCQKNGRDVYTNSLLMAAGVFISGNNFDKLSLFNDFFGPGFISKTTYNRMQTHFVIPEITRYWEQMKNEIWHILSDEFVILCGNGWNDSPGHSAKYCMYAIIEQHLDLIVDVEVVDKRQTKGISTNMEVFVLKTILERMVGKIFISEVVTDPSAAIIALVRKMKGNECLKF